jgi:hypothetical protein
MAYYNDSFEKQMGGIIAATFVVGVMFGACITIFLVS